VCGLSETSGPAEASFRLSAFPPNAIETAPALDDAADLPGADAPDKTEVLHAVLVRSEGDPVELFADFHRQNAKVKLGDTETVRGGQHYMFAPIYEAWGRALPSEWKG
jgi:uncharacterized protein (DUF2345 family)